MIECAHASRCVASEGGGAVNERTRHMHMYMYMYMYMYIR